MVAPSLTFVTLAFLTRAFADVSLYPLPTLSAEEPGHYIGYKSYDPTELQVPPLPSPLPPLDFDIEVLTEGVQGLSIPIPGSFLGFSIEMSITDVVVGPNGTVLWPQFLNLLSTLKERGGPPVVRIGGNTQEKATLVNETALPPGVVIQKQDTGATGVTETPTILYKEDIFYAMSNVSALLGVQWYLGLPLAESDPPRIAIAEAAERILGNNLVSFQLGNEPDLYVSHQYKTEYSIPEYFQDFGNVIQALNNDPNVPVKKIVGGPSTCCTVGWFNNDMVQAGFITQFQDALNVYIIEHYPENNCGPASNNYTGQDLATIMMNHTFQVDFATHYLIPIQAATEAGLPVVLLETNTASCGGFVGMSDAFTSTLWALDQAMSLAVVGFQHMMLHMGGQGVYYNPFVPPPENATAPYEWTVGAVYYAALVSAEVFGTSGKAQIVDLQANGNSIYTPGYAIYENGAPARVLLINYMSDSTAAYTAHVSLGAQANDNSATPQSVTVRYLLAPTIVSKRNITWAGQSFGGYFEADGLLHGEDTTSTQPCTGGVCSIQVPAPGAVLVFLNGNVPTGEPQQFTTTYSTERYNTATVDQVVLATSNGMSGAQRAAMGSTSHGGHLNSAGRAALVSVTAVILAGVTGFLALAHA